MTDTQRIVVSLSPNGRMMASLADITSWLRSCAQSLHEAGKTDEGIGVLAIAEELTDFWIEAAHREMDGSL